MSALFDFSSLLIVILLFICTTTFTRSMYPTIFNTAPNPNEQDANTFSNGTSKVHHDGLRGICWKASRIGERVSEYVAVFCVIMAFHILFLKA